MPDTSNVPLPPEPEGLAATRQSLHRLATYVIAPVRYRATGRFGLRATPDGFGTPPFPDRGGDRRIRVAGTTLIDEVAGEARTTPITTLRAAAEWLGADIDPATAAEADTTPLGDPDAPLAVDGTAARFLGRWYEVAFAALEQLRADPATADPSEPQLWPGHFDTAIEAGDDDHRASYGASPGDGPDGRPYLYVSVWWPDRLGLAHGADAPTDPFWDAATFAGRRLALADFPPGADPVEVAAAFFGHTRARLDALPARPDQQPCRG